MNLNATTNDVKYNAHLGSNGSGVGQILNDTNNTPLLNAYNVSVTPDPTKSGLITKFSGLTLGTVPSEKLGNFYIHY